MKIFYNFTNYQLFFYLQNIYGPESLSIFNHKFNIELIFIKILFHLLFHLYLLLFIIFFIAVKANNNSKFLLS
jgi:hypothetical protein